LRWFSAWLRVIAKATFDIEMAWTTAERTHRGQLLGSSVPMRFGEPSMNVSDRSALRPESG